MDRQARLFAVAAAADEDDEGHRHHDGRDHIEGDHDDRPAATAEDDVRGGGLVTHEPGGLHDHVRDETETDFAEHGHDPVAHDFPVAFPPGGRGPGDFGPDELIIQSNDLPPESEATLLLPDLDAESIVEAAAARLGPPTLKVVDEHAIGCRIGDVAYVPLPNARIASLGSYRSSCRRTLSEGRSTT